MKGIFIYPAIFHPEDDGSYSVSFPDFNGCSTIGNNQTDALIRAIEVAGSWLIESMKFNNPIPEPTNIKLIKLENKNDFLTLVYIDLLEYQKKNNNKAVKKTLSIPAWLNDIAEEKNVNYSKILQAALIEYLGLKKYPID